MSESKADKLEAMRHFFLKQPLQSKWRIKKREMVGFTRYQITQLLYDTKEPLGVSQLAFKTGQSICSIASHVRVLVDNNIICDKLYSVELPHTRGSRPRFFCVCPVCPVKDDCKEKLEFWVKSGLMEPEPLPSEQFAEAGK